LAEWLRIRRFRQGGCGPAIAIDNIGGFDYMKKLIGTVLSLTLLGMMAIPAAAQGRNSYNSSQETTRRQQVSRGGVYQGQNKYNDRDRRNEFENGRQQESRARDQRWDNNDRFRNQGQGGLNVLSLIFSGINSHNTHDRNHR
jgi:hypothetical protein